MAQICLRREVVPAYGIFTLLIQLVVASTMIAGAWLAGSGQFDGAALAAGLLLALRTA